MLSPMNCIYEGNLKVQKFQKWACKNLKTCPDLNLVQGHLPVCLWAVFSSPAIFKPLSGSLSTCTLCFGVPVLCGHVTRQRFHWTLCQNKDSTQFRSFPLNILHHTDCCPRLTPHQSPWALKLWLLRWARPLVVARNRALITGYETPCEIQVNLKHKLKFSLRTNLWSEEKWASAQCTWS